MMAGGACANVIKMEIILERFLRYPSPMTQSSSYGRGTENSRKMFPKILINRK
jgi:hypothetical protein